MDKVLDFLLETDGEIGIAILNPELGVLFVNSKMETYYHAIVGELFPPKTTLQKIINLSIQQNKDIQGLPVHETLDGDSLHSLLYTYLHRENHMITSITVIVCDLRSIHTSFQSQIHQEKLQIIGNMAAGTVNVILNPLAVVKGALQLIEQSIRKDVISIDLSTHPLNQKLEQYFHLAYEQVEQIDHLLERFLLLGKPSEIKLVPISIVSFLQKWIPDVQNKALNHNITLICEYPNTHGQVLADEVRLKEILSALLQNAFEATNKEGIVKIRAEITEGTVDLIIEDQGEGLSEDLIQRMKEPFFTTKEEALGFGLTFCEGVLQKMGGSLDIRSSSEGTEVRVNLPKIP